MTEPFGSFELDDVQQLRHFTLVILCMEMPPVHLFAKRPAKRDKAEESIRRQAALHTAVT